MADPGVVAARIRGVSKRFMANQALDAVGLEIAAGEIHALVGGNGSGKSTLIKILAGIQCADHGTMETPEGLIDLTSTTPSLAEVAGFRFVHQARSTFANLTVAENLSIGRGFETGPARIIRGRRVRSRVSSVLERFGIEARPDDLVRTLGPANQAMLAIARALQDQAEHHARVLVLDEPTAALPAAEVDVLLTALRDYARSGTAVLYVSHRLDEVMTIADRVTALRDGVSVATHPREELTHDKLVELIAGSTSSPRKRSSARTEHASVVLSAVDLSGGTVEDVSLTVKSGEIVGLTGLAGAGSSTLLRLIFGIQPMTKGELRVAGEQVRTGKPRAAIAAGIAFVPPDRSDFGMFGSLSIAENMSAVSVRDYWRGARLRLREERRDATAAFDKFLIRAEAADQPVAQLSGGNQQKVLVARWLRNSSRRVILLDEPTQGVDIGAKREIWSVIRQAVDAGAGVLVASTDLEELCEVCDRVVVLRRGRVARELNNEDLTVDRLIEGVHAMEVAP